MVVWRSSVSRTVNLHTGTMGAHRACFHRAACPSHSPKLRSSLTRPFPRVRNLPWFAHQLASARKKSGANPRTIARLFPMMSLTTLLIRGDLWGTASLNPSFGTDLLRVSPRSLLMQTGLIQTHFRANIPPRGRGTDRGGRTSLPGGRSRLCGCADLTGEPDTGLNGGEGVVRKNVASSPCTLSWRGPLFFCESPKSRAEPERDTRALRVWRLCDPPAPVGLLDTPSTRRENPSSPHPPPHIPSNLRPLLMPDPMTRDRLDAAGVDNEAA